MSTSLARRIRRIGLLPQVPLEEVLDSEMLTKLKNARQNAATGEPAAVANLVGLEADLARQLAPRRVQRLELTAEDVAKQAQALKDAAKAKRVENRLKAVAGTASRVAALKKAFATKGA